MRQPIHLEEIENQLKGTKYAAHRVGRGKLVHLFIYSASVFSRQLCQPHEWETGVPDRHQAEPEDKVCPKCLKVFKKLGPGFVLRQKEDWQEALNRTQVQLEKDIHQIKDKMMVFEPGQREFESFASLQPVLKKKAVAPITLSHPVDELRRLSMSEPNPVTRQQYIRELLAAEGNA